MAKSHKTTTRAKNPTLTIKQEGFVTDYLAHGDPSVRGNASECYRRNYSTFNMKPATVNRAAKALLDNSKIAARIAAHKRRNGITVNRILQEERRLAFFDFRKFFSEEGMLLSPGDLPDDIAHIVSGFECEETELFVGRGKNRKSIGIKRHFKYKLSDKGAALGRLEKHKGMYEKDNAQREVTLRIVYDESRPRDDNEAGS